MGFSQNAHVVLGELENVMDAVKPEEIENAIKLITESDKIFFNALGRAGFMGKSLDRKSVV